MLTVSENSGTFTLAPEGTHVAICIGVVDCGTHASEFQGVRKESRKIRLMFEIPEEGVDEKPHTVGMMFNASLHERSTLRKMLESWRGKPFSAEELKGFSLAKLLGKPCLVQIQHKPSADGRVFDNITSIVAMPKGTPTPPQTNPSVIFDIDEWDQAKYDALPEFLKKKIAASPEGSAILGVRSATVGKPLTTAPSTVSGDIPF